VELFALSVVYNDCRWNCGSVEYFLVIVVKLCVYAVVYSDLRGNSAHSQ